MPSGKDAENPATSDAGQVVSAEDEPQFNVATRVQLLTFYSNLERM